MTIPFTSLRSGNLYEVQIIDGKPAVYIQCTSGVSSTYRGEIVVKMNELTSSTPFDIVNEIVTMELYNQQPHIY